jgi:hypothetical protein
MNVNWYSNHVKPILDFNEMGGILIAMDGDIYTTYSYDKETNECWSESYSEPISLSSPRVKGWCYVKDVYPRETVI